MALVKVEAIRSSFAGSRRCVPRSRVRSARRRCCLTGQREVGGGGVLAGPTAVWESGTSTPIADEHLICFSLANAKPSPTQPLCCVTGEPGRTT
jgi:hypothetical protein